MDRGQVRVGHLGAGVLDEGVLIGLGGQPAGELLREVHRAGDLHGVRRRAVDGDVGRLVGGRVDAEARPGGPHLRLVDVGDLAPERQLLIVRAGQLKAAQHAAFTRLAPGLVAGPQQADAELAVGIVFGAEVVASRRLALLRADLLDARGRRRRGVGPVLAAGEGAHVDGLGHLEAVLVGAVDDLRGVGGALGPVQAVAALGVVERVVAARAEGGATAQADRMLAVVAAGQCGDEACDEQAAKGGEQQRAPRRGGVQALPPRRPV